MTEHDKRLPRRIQFQRRHVLIIFFVLVFFAISAYISIFMNSRGMARPDPSEELKELILQKYSDFGFTRIDSVDLQNCELTIEVNYNRICPPAGTVTGKFDHTTIIIQLDELSDHKSDSTILEGIGEEILIWSVDPSVIDIHHRASDIINNFAQDHPRTISNMSSINETWAYTKLVLNEDNIRSREISRNCSGELAFQHFNGAIRLPFKPMTASTVLTALRDYKSIQCSAP